MNTLVSSSKIIKQFQKQVVINDLSLNINKGDIYALLGLNGAGKTTFMKLLLKHLKLTAGTFRYELALNEIGVIVETPTFYNELSGYDNLKMHAILNNVAVSKVDEVLQIVGLIKDKKQVRKYSLGMKQRLAIARALLTSPKLLVLDEPINGLDPTGVYEIRNLLLKINELHGITILISSHILAEVESIATRYGIIHNGTTIAEFSKSEEQQKTTAVVEECVDYANFRERLNFYKAQHGFKGAVFIDKKGYFYGEEVFLNAYKESLEVTSLEKYFIAVTGGVREI